MIPTAAMDTHPDDQSLREFLTGNLTDQQRITQIEQHVESCEQCLDRMDTVEQEPLGFLSAALIRSAGQDESSPGDFVPTIPGYQIDCEIGRGGMGIVYRARHLRMNREVAIKTLPLGSANRRELLARFDSEIKALSALKHPNIIQVYEVGEHAGVGYIALEFVEGGDLDKHLAGQRMIPDQAARLVAQLAGAIHAAHQQGIIHRDLKPGNILLDSQGKPKIADFGLAKHLDSNSSLTRTGMCLGTPGYMAPEQISEGAHAAGTASDVYGLGALFYHCLIGKPPFSGNSIAHVLKQVVTTEPASPRSLRKSVPRDLETICMKCLAVEPVERYASAAAIEEDIRRYFANESILAKPITTSEQLWRWSQRNPVVASLSLLLLLAIVTASIVSTSLWIQAESARIASENSSVELAKSLVETESANRRATSSLYASRIGNSWANYHLSNLRLARTQLENCRSNPDLTSLLGWEWHYVNDVINHELVHFQLPGSVGVARSVAFHPELPVIAAAFGSLVWRRRDALPGTIALIHSQTGELLHQFDAHQGRINHIEFSRDGKFLASCASDKTLRLWKFAGNKASSLQLDIKPIAQRQGTGTSSICRFNDATTTLAYQAGNHQLFLMDLSNDRDTLIYETEHQILSFDLYAEQQLAVALKTEWRFGCRLEVLDLDGNSKRLLSRSISGDTSTLRWMNHGQNLVFSTVSHGCLVMSAEHDYQPQLLSPHSGHVVGLAESHDGRLLATGDSKGDVRIWDGKTKQLRATIKGHARTIADLSFAPHDGSLASAAHDGTIRVWDLTRPTEQVWHRAARRTTVAMTTTPDNEHVVIVGPQVCQTVNTITGKVVQEFDTPTTDIKRYPRRDHAVSPTGDRVAVAGNDRSEIHVFDPATGEQIHHLTGHADPVEILTFSGDSRWLASVSIRPKGRPTSRTLLWDLTAENPVSVELPARDYSAICASLNHDGSLLAIGLSNTRVRVYRLPSGQRVHEFSDVLQCTGLAFCQQPTPRLAAASIRDATVHVWDLSDGSLLYDPLPAPSLVTSVTFSSDGARLAAVGQHADLQLWNTETGDALLTIEGFGKIPGNRGWTPEVAFSKNDRDLISTSVDAGINVHTIPDPHRSAVQQRRESFQARLPYWQLTQIEESLTGKRLDAVRFHLNQLRMPDDAGHLEWYRVHLATAQLERIKEASDAIDRAIAIAPENPWMYERRGLFRFQQKQFAEAKADLLKAQSLFRNALRNGTANVLQQCNQNLQRQIQTPPND